MCYKLCIMLASFLLSLGLLFLCHRGVRLYHAFALPPVSTGYAPVPFTITLLTRLIPNYTLRSNCRICLLCIPSALCFHNFSCAYSSHLCRRTFNMIG
ncbi:hypothetical protein BDN70DRAFT_888874 [Pholiota conissans]|uniref:Uncharacterized protein n=1 Tax=Pholiota conissans TaxID=109636 RepID=A0A9P5YKM9_9AGAR|nr:hypothetical protein BDN70DRAFT_888874 [Pholiota conissans]